MMNCTDRYFRYLVRLISKQVLLYTEMIHAHAIVQGQGNELLAYDEIEHPIALQLGGCDPIMLSKATMIAADLGYDEVNLNIGCPSERVQAGRFGACLMAEPQLVADCIAAMQAVVDIPVTVKTRIGIDEHDNYEFLHNFITTVSQAGCEVFIVHARKAWLKGLSPKQNRSVPPLDYNRVYQLQSDFPQLTFVLNGGVTSLAEATPHIGKLAGVMIGRAAYADPYLFVKADELFYDDLHKKPNRREVLNEFCHWYQALPHPKKPLTSLLPHLFGLFSGVVGAKTWRRHISEQRAKLSLKPDLLLENLPAC